MSRFLAIAAVLTALSAVPGWADEPLHTQIDALIAAKAGGAVAAKADDAEFVRRIYLDLVGRLPTAAEAKAFIEDKDPKKREKLIDKLLSSAEHPVRMTEAFHVMLTERLGDHAEWQTWLLESFKNNKPWDAMCREMLAPHQEDDPNRGAGMFLSKRLENYGQNPVDYPALVRDVGRLMLGVDLQCAQCHDHPQVHDYKQVDFQGLYVYFLNVSLRSGSAWPAVIEKPLTSKLEFQSVFLAEKHQVGPRVPFGMETMIPVFDKGQEYEVPPDKKTKSPGVPKFSPLKVLSSELPRPETKGFSTNIANRLWWLTMGRGLVEPLDLAHSDNPPSHPELLELLGREIAAHQYDLRWFLKELMLSDAYQRSSRLPEGADESAEIPAASYRVAIEKPLFPEQTARALLTATGPWAGDETAQAKRLKDVTDRAVKALGQPARVPETEFAPSVKGALFLSHDSVLLGLLEPHSGNLADRLVKATDASAAADDAFLSVFSRLPADDERAAFVEYLGKHADDKAAAVKNFLWAMLSSNEFAVNH